MTVTQNQVALLMSGLDALIDAVDAAPTTLYLRGDGPEMVRDARNLKNYIQSCLAQGDLTIDCSNAINDRAALEADE